VVTRPGYNLDEVRQAFPISQHLTYLNYASISPIPLPAQQAMVTVADLLTSDPMSLYEPGGAWGDIRVTFPTEVAALIHAARPEEVVGVTSTSAALNAVAQAIDWQPGDNIVFTDLEFPSNAYPWMVLERQHQVECRLAPPDRGGASVEGFEPLVDGHTRLIAVSAVQFLTGHRTDLHALGTFCRERGILFAVDAIQAAGHIPIDVQAMQIDILAAGGQKSLMGLPGEGFLYVRDEVCDRMRPGFVGSNATADYEHWLHYDLTPREGALRFMMGTPNLAGMVVLIESIRFLGQLGLPNIEAWTRHLSQIALEDLAGRGYTVITPTDPAHLGPIVSFRVGDPDDLKAADGQATAMLEHLRANHIRVAKHWDARGRSHLRISSHCYNTEDEVRRVGAVLEDYKP
jgi:cysteine desulfurase/selenocysteine lyase